MTQKSRTVLVVDDDPDLRLSLTILLTVSCNAQVHDACDGEAALSLASQITPDVAFIDLAMPTMDGFALTRALRKYPTWNNTLFVALSGYCSEQDILDSREAGFHLHLAKPTEPETLYDIVLNPERYRNNAPSKL